MELKIPIEVDFDDLKSLIDDLGQLQKYKLFESDKMVLVDVDDVANVLVKHIKAKEAQPKTGKWINGHWDGDSNFRIDGRGNCWYVRECSNCHEEIKGKPTNYCPNCGCHMLEEGEEHD